MRSAVKMVFLERHLLLYICLSIAVLFFSSVSQPVFAQSPDALEAEFEQNYNEMFGSPDGSSKLGEAVWGIRDALLKFLKVLMGLASLGALVLAIYNLYVGESGGAKRLFMWMAGLAVGTTLLSVVGGINPEVTSGGGFAGLQGLIAELLEAVLCVICMITLAVVSIHIMNGEKDGFQKLIRWFLVSSIGLVLLELLKNFNF